MTADLTRPILLWRCPECGSVRTVIGDCHNTAQHSQREEAVATEAVEYVPREVGE